MNKQFNEKKVSAKIYVKVLIRKELLKTPWFRSLLSIVVLICSNLPVVVSAANSALSHEVIPFNSGAGRGDHLFIRLRLEDNSEGLFLLDTGCPSTIIDRSLESSLGKRIGTGSFSYAYFGKQKVNIYKAPNLYVRNSKLNLGKTILTEDLRIICPEMPVMGIIGLDCLQNYCFQLDFDRHILSFFDSEVEPKVSSGEKFPIDVKFGVASVRIDVMGSEHLKMRLDTGLADDAVFSSSVFDSIMAKTNVFAVSSNLFAFDGYVGKSCYTNILFFKYPNPSIWDNLFECQNLLGLRFLARHLVVFDFPNHQLYLKNAESETPKENSPSSPIASHVEIGHDFTNAQDNRLLGQWEHGVSKLLHNTTNVFASIYSWSPLKLVSVGPPVDELSVVYLPARSYGSKYTSEFVTEKGREPKLLLKRGVLSSGGNELKTIGTVFLIHDFAEQKESLSPWAYNLAQRGFNVISVDLRGHGNSVGTNIYLGKYEIADLQQVISCFQTQNMCGAKIGIMGVGYGGFLALNLASIDSRIGSVVVIDPYEDTRQMIAKLAEHSDVTLSSESINEIQNMVSERLGNKWSEMTAEAALRNVKVPVLFIHSGTNCYVETTVEMTNGIVPPGSKHIMIPEANYRTIKYWFHELENPVSDWFKKELF